MASCCVLLWVNTNRFHPCPTGLLLRIFENHPIHYNAVMMRAMASQITSLTIVYSTVYSRADRWPVNSPQEGPVTRKMFPFNDATMCLNSLKGRDAPIFFLLRCFMQFWAILYRITKKLFVNTLGLTETKWRPFTINNQPTLIQMIDRRQDIIWINGALVSRRIYGSLGLRVLNVQRW